MTGTVKFFDATKGWGFITPADGGPEVFVHYTEIAGTGYRTLHEGDQVRCETRITERGQSARNVTVLRAAPVPEPALKRFHD